MTVAPDRRPLAVSDVDEVARVLRAAGHRVSAPARHVLEALFAADGPVSADRIAAGVEGRTRTLDLSSVYRNLERLEQLGVVSHVHLGHGPGLYALARERDREYLVCDRCGRVESLDPARLDAVRASIRGAFGYHARFSHFPMHGLCGPCATKGDQVSHHHHDHEHDEAHSHEHSHGDVVHSHPHASHEHDHTEHEHEHSHGDRVHSHPHVHEAGLEHDHEHEHDGRD